MAYSNASIQSKTLFPYKLIISQEKKLRLLWGAFLFLCCIYIAWGSSMNEFPSPMGIFFISMIIKASDVQHLQEFPSLMGIFFISIQGRDKDLDILVNEFPSPLGSFFISMKYTRMIKNAHPKFPSPMGIFLFLS